MTTTPEPRIPSEAEWIRRCAARIQALDDEVSASDAAELAQTLWGRPSCRRFDPETIAQRLHDQVLSASQWGDL